METGGKRPFSIPSYAPAVALCVLVERDEDCNVAIRHRVVQQLLHDKGRVKPLGVKVACCKLEFAAEQEQREQEATRRARVEANVRAALAAREPEAKAGSSG